MNVVSVTGLGAFALAAITGVLVTWRWRSGPLLVVELASFAVIGGATLAFVTASVVLSWMERKSAWKMLRREVTTESAYAPVEQGFIDERSALPTYELNRLLKNRRRGMRTAMAVVATKGFGVFTVAKSFPLGAALTWPSLFAALRHGGGNLVLPMICALTALVVGAVQVRREYLRDVDVLEATIKMSDLRGGDYKIRTQAEREANSSAGIPPSGSDAVATDELEMRRKAR
jgi:hypothetical protein